jgi:hypothetical protein
MRGKRVAAPASLTSVGTPNISQPFDPIWFASMEKSKSDPDARRRASERSTLSNRLRRQKVSLAPVRALEDEAN